LSSAGIAAWFVPDMGIVGAGAAGGAVSDRQIDGGNKSRKTANPQIPKLALFKHFRIVYAKR
jgi:hypothetical protein